jgi:hypothetical protein
VTTPASQDAWNLDRVRQIVAQNELERGRLEYKRELGNGRGALEAITALANTFGGVILIGVDEDKQGLDRITGVKAAERNRLVSMCWSQLTPPFDPEIIPIKLDHDDLYILAVVIDTGYIRRPVMLNQGNKVLVRLEDQNKAPDWYRLRDLFTEQSSSSQDASLPPTDTIIHTPDDQERDVDLILRGRLLLTGPRGRPTHITGPGRDAALATLDSNNTPLTGSGSSLVSLMSQVIPGSFDVSSWQLDGRANAQQFTARWQGLAPKGRALTEARISVEIRPRPARGDDLLITIDARLANPGRPRLVDAINSMPPREAFPDEDPKAHLDAFFEATAYDKAPFIGIGALRALMLDITGSLWGLPGETLSTTILGQPLGPPALLDMTIFTVPVRSRYGDPEPPPLNECIDFGAAQLIPGNTPNPATRLGPVQPDQTQLSSPAAQGPLIHDWLVQLGIDNGYQNIEQEVSRWTGLGSVKSWV